MGGGGLAPPTLSYAACEELQRRSEGGGEDKDCAWHFLRPFRGLESVDSVPFQRCPSSAGSSA